MTPQQVGLVQASFAQVVPLGAQAGALFYRRLFQLAPEVQALFGADMEEQGRKLIAMLATVVNGLHRLDVIVPAAQKLAQRHVAYGARPEHYPVVGAALLDTLQAGLGEAFTPEVREAWVAAYGELSCVMIQAQNSVQLAS